jgi:putative flippase GtrA
VHFKKIKIYLRKKFQVPIINYILNNSLYKRFIGFALVGVFNTFFSLLLTFLLINIVGLWLMPSYVIVFLITVFLAYLINTYFVFKKEFELKKLIGFYSTYLSSLILGIALLYIIKFFSPDSDDFINTILITPITMTWNFFFLNNSLKKN